LSPAARGPIAFLAFEGLGGEGPQGGARPKKKKNKADTDRRRGALPIPLRRGTLRWVAEAQVTYGKWVAEQDGPVGAGSPWYRTSHRGSHGLGFRSPRMCVPELADRRHPASPVGTRGLGRRLSSTSSTASGGQRRYPARSLSLRCAEGEIHSRARPLYASLGSSRSTSTDRHGPMGSDPGRTNLNHEPLNRVLADEAAAGAFRAGTDS